MPQNRSPSLQLARLRSHRLERAPHRIFADQALQTQRLRGYRIAARLNGSDILFLQHHGVIVCGDSVAYAFDDLYYLERACMVQVLAQGSNKVFKRVPHHVAATTAKQWAGERQQSILHLASLRRMLDREEPGWSVL